MIRDGTASPTQNGVVELELARPMGPAVVGRAPAADLRLAARQTLTYGEFAPPPVLTRGPAEHGPALVVHTDPE